MLKHHITKYRNVAGEQFVTTWFQINLFGGIVILLKKTLAI